MKKIYSAILFLAAVLCLVPVASAQSYTRTYPGVGSLTFKGNPNDYGTNSEVGVSKHISAPVDGTYWIKLEAFATGEATKTSTPSDFVLVLDVSGSMNYDMQGNQTNVNANRRITALKTAVNSFIDEVNTNDTKDMGGNTRENRLGNRIAIVTFATDAEVENELTYLGSSVTDNGGVADLKRTVNNLSVGGGTYAHKGMQEAYDLISFNDDNRKSRTVVLFTDGVPGLWGSWTESDNAYNNSIYDWPERQYSNYYEYYYIPQRVDTYNTANATIAAANQIKEIADDTKKIISNVFTVSIITNPTTHTQVYLGKTSSNYLNATSMGTWEDTYHTPIQSGDWEYGGDGKGEKNSEATVNYALTATTAEELKAAFDAIAGLSGDPKNTDLTASTSTIDIVSSSFKLSGTTVSADMIKLYTAPYLFNKTTKTLEFGTETLVDESDDEFDYYVYTKDPVTGAVTKDYRGKRDVDAGVEVDPDELSDGVVKVTGFDFTNNWCGPIKEDGKVAGAQGHKLVILIPIEMGDDAVGGPNVVTNAEGSGIFVSGDDESPLVDFVSPTVSLPVNLSIKKANLGHGENAKFVIQRAVATEQRPADADATWHPDYSNLTGWEYVTSVFFPNKNGSDEVKIKGLPSTPDNEGYYVYRVIEEDWSWTYTFQSASGEGYVKENDKVVVKNKTISDKFGVYTDQFVKNPITFTNQYEVDSDKRVRHAESKVTNTFVPKTTGSTEGTVTTSDSKNNDR